MMKVLGAVFAVGYAAALIITSILAILTGVDVIHLGADALFGCSVVFFTWCIIGCVMFWAGKKYEL